MKPRERRCLPRRPRRRLAVSIVLASIALGLVALACRSDEIQQGSTRRRLITRSSESYSVSAPGATKAETMILRNVGDTIVRDPRVIVNGRGDWFSIDTILSEIVEDGASDKEKALAIWEFLVANRHHDDPVHDQGEMHDPVRLLNIYGYGFCDDAANSFMMLARQAGVKARIWHLGGHVVSEAYYDGEWHMFDADGEVFYLAGNGKTIAGVSRLAGNPRLIRRKPSPNPLYHDTEHLVDLYSSRSDNRVAGWYSGRSRHLMALDLRPGESILRSRNNWGLYLGSRFGTEPKTYGNGRFVFEPVFRDDVFHQGAHEVTGVHAEAVGGVRHLVFAPGGDPGEDGARLTYRIVSPYPLLAGRVRIVGDLRGEGTVELRLSRNDEHWTRVWTSSGSGRIDAQIFLDRFLPRKSGRPFYHYLLSLVHTARAEGAEWRVETLRYEHDFQVAPHALPTFDEGTNEVRYLDAGVGEREVELVFEYAD